MANTPRRDLQEEFLAATRKSQENVIRAIKAWVETVMTATPKLPSIYAALGDRLPKLPGINVPLADKLPTPEDVVASSYDFAQHVLATQRRFAEDLLKAMAPLLPGDSKSVKVDTAATSEPKGAITETAPKPAAPKIEPQAPAAQSEPKTPPVPTAPVPLTAGPTTPPPPTRDETPAAPSAP